MPLFGWLNDAHLVVFDLDGSDHRCHRLSHRACCILIEDLLVTRGTGLTAHVAGISRRRAQEGRLDHGLLIDAIGSSGLTRRTGLPVHTRSDDCEHGSADKQAAENLWIRVSFHLVDRSEFLSVARN
jgi:hypothetical protein